MTFNPYTNTKPFGELTESEKATLRGKPCVVFRASRGTKGWWTPATPDLFKDSSFYRWQRPARERPAQ